MSSFLDQYNENLRAYRRRWPQRLLKIVIVIGAVLIVAPCTSVIGKQFGPTAAFFVAFSGLLATLVVWWVASLLLSRATAPAIDPVVPPQPGSPFAQPFGGPTNIPPLSPAAPPPTPPASRGGGLGLALVVIGGVLLLSCCGGGVALMALIGGARLHQAAPAAPQTADDPFAEFGRQQRQMEDQMRRQEKQFRDMERDMQRDPFGK